MNGVIKGIGLCKKDPIWAQTHPDLLQEKTNKKGLDSLAYNQDQQIKAMAAGLDRNIERNICWSVRQTKKKLQLATFKTM